MAPVRRYLRITKYSVLECRIYLDNPSLAQSWLLHPRHNVLPRVIESIRPLVLPKLREEKERERSKKKSSKKSRVKDVIVQDDFEVSMFLTETGTRHSLLTKRKNFRPKGPPPMHSNASKLISETNDQPVDVDADDFAPIRIEEESDEEAPMRLADIPTAEDKGGEKRDREEAGLFVGSPSDEQDTPGAIEVNSDDEERPSKRRRGVGEDFDFGDGEGDGDDKKKLAMDVSYEGFAIYGRVLCLVVKRKASAKASQASANGAAATSGQAKMENWITSTQMEVDEV